jgi:hypothetical protein
MHRHHSSWHRQLSENDRRRVIAGGDLNVAMNKDTVFSQKLKEKFTDNNIVQHVTGMTHEAGNTLDLVMTFGTLSLDSIVVCERDVRFDHHLIISAIRAAVSTSLKVNVA